MRFVLAEQLNVGMKLAQDIYNAAGQLLIAENSILTQEQMLYIVKLGVPGVYINDGVDWELKDKAIVTPQIRKNAVELVYQSFGEAEETEANNAMATTELAIREQVENIVNCVLSQDDVINNLVELKTYDDYTYFHSVNVAVLSGVIGAKCGLSPIELENLVIAGFLHDIGKIFIDPSLLNAPRKLTAEERVLMMDHPEKGAEYLRNHFGFSDDVAKIVLEHHEWYNGSGYPNAKSWRNSNFLSRILKAADVYDAMTSKRPYHLPYLPSEVMEYIMGRSGMEFDPVIVEVMMREFCVYPVGCRVLLSDHREAIVQENHRGYILRPTVKVMETGEVINLKSDRNALNITVAKVLL